MRYFIIGFKCSGKTTMGRKLANKLDMKFVDLDEYIEEKESDTIPNLYTKVGDEKFRIYEWKALQEIVKKDNIVISTGGGVPCNSENMKIMKEAGKVVYLKIEDDILVSRLEKAANSRPIIKGKSRKELEEYVAELKEKCGHHYETADYKVEGRNLKVEDVLNIIS